jgi:hypothetical protein
MRALMWKYRDLPMDLAAASLVAVAERDGVNKVFTIDQRGFGVYRPAKLGRLWQRTASRTSACRPARSTAAAIRSLRIAYPYCRLRDVSPPASCRP